MRTLAHEYVASERFSAVSPVQFDTLVRAGLQVDAVISVWVLQHCFKPTEDIACIRRGLAVDGRAFILNMPKRAVPAVFDQAESKRRFGWAEDGIDIAQLLRHTFEVLGESVLDRTRTPNMADVGAYWMSLRQRPDFQRLA
jgi:hypothetical protein